MSLSAPRELIVTPQNCPPSRGRSDPNPIRPNTRGVNEEGPRDSQTACKFLHLHYNREKRSSHF